MPPAIQATAGAPIPRARGQAMVEFAVALLFFVGMLLAIFEGARLVATFFAVANAAADGARAGAFAPTTQLPTATLDGNVRAAVRETTSFLGTIPDASITICRRTSPTAACGTPVRSGSIVDVTIDYTFYFVPFAGGWLGLTSVPVTGYHRVQID